MYKRVLLKLSGEALGAKDEPVCFERIEETAKCIKEVWQLGVQIGIVLGGGNIWRGRASGDMDRNRADQMGMLSTAINSIAMQDALERIGVSSSVLSALDIPYMMNTYTSREAKALFSQNHVIIFACGTGHPYFSTDTGAALRAAEIDADALLLAKNMEYVCSDDPIKNPNAKRYKHISYDKFIADGLQAMDQTAICFCRDRGLKVRAFKLSKENIQSAVKGEDVGTLIDGSGQTIEL